MGCNSCKPLGNFKRDKINLESLEDRSIMYTDILKTQCPIKMVNNNYYIEIGASKNFCEELSKICYYSKNQRSICPKSFKINYEF